VGERRDTRRGGVSEPKSHRRNQAEALDCGPLVDKVRAVSVGAKRVMPSNPLQLDAGGSPRGAGQGFPGPSDTNEDQFSRQVIDFQSGR